MDIETIVREVQERMDELRGKRIRLIRVVTYEGDAVEIVKQMSRSLPQGTRECNGYTISVIEHLVEILEEPKALEEEPLDSV